MNTTPPLKKTQISGIDKLCVIKRIFESVLFNSQTM